MYAFRSSMVLSLAIDDESVPVGDGRDLLLLEAGHPGSRRTLAQPPAEGLDPLGLPRHLDLHAAVRQVAHPAREVSHLLRRLAGEPAEAHPLYPAAHPDAERPAAAHFCGFQPWRPS